MAQQQNKSSHICSAIFLRRIKNKCSIITTEVYDSMREESFSCGEREILREEEFIDGLYCFDDSRDREKCMYCGYDILEGEEAVKVYSTGDIIHRKCWIDYAEDNIEELCLPLGERI